MNIVKTIILFFGLITTVLLIEDFVEKTIIHTKLNHEDIHDSYVRGLLSTVNIPMLLFVSLLWSVFYLLST